jgi:hypothetical protein
MVARDHLGTRGIASARPPVGKPRICRKARNRLSAELASWTVAGLHFLAFPTTNRWRSRGRIRRRSIAARRNRNERKPRTILEYSVQPLFIIPRLSRR